MGPRPAGGRRRPPAVGGDGYGAARRPSSTGRRVWPRAPGSPSTTGARRPRRLASHPTGQVEMHTQDRPHARRPLLPLLLRRAPQDRVLGFTALGLAAVLALSLVRCSSAALSTVDSELGAVGSRTSPLGGAHGAVGPPL